MLARGGVGVLSIYILIRHRWKGRSWRRRRRGIRGVSWLGGWIRGGCRLLVRLFEGSMILMFCWGSYLDSSPTGCVLQSIEAFLHARYPTFRPSYHPIRYDALHSQRALLGDCRSECARYGYTYESCRQIPGAGSSYIPVRYPSSSTLGRGR